MIGREPVSPKPARILVSREFNTAAFGESFRKTNAKSSTKECAEFSGIGRFVGARIFPSRGFSARTPLISRTASLRDSGVRLSKLSSSPCARRTWALQLTLIYSLTCPRLMNELKKRNKKKLRRRIAETARQKTRPIAARNRTLH